MCLYDFASKYDYKTKPCSHFNKQENLSCFKLKNNLGFICKRIKSKLIKIPTIKPIDETSTEEYFHQLLFCFKPWSIEANLKLEFNSYQEAFKHSITENSINEIYSEFIDQRQKIQKAIQICKKLAEESRNDDLESNHSENSANELDFSISNSQNQLLNLGN